METYHNGDTARHLGIYWTFMQIIKDYWWPDLCRYTRAYIKGCGTCQQNKTNTHPTKPPLNPIFPPQEAEPFKVISIDLITKLPASQGNDTILMITDQGSTKGVILIPCKEAMGAEELATLYVECTFPYIGLPSRLISDRDTRFTGGLFREICQQLGIKQNISSAYHPETDGQSERTNQTVETALCIFRNFWQDDWSRWLLIVQYQMNAHISNTTGIAPYDVWFGYTPRSHQPDRPTSMPLLEKRKKQLKEAWLQAQEAMTQAQQGCVKESRYKPYAKGERVWLEGKNLRTSHPTTKLRPKRFGPFTITEVLGPTMYRLDFPAVWKIHNAFHGMLLTPVTVDESVREEDRSDDDEKDENVKDDICQLLDQRTASQRRDKSCAPSH